MPEDLISALNLVIGAPQGTCFILHWGNASNSPRSIYQYLTQLRGFQDKPPFVV